jgi:hypothetical protein
MAGNAEPKPQNVLPVDEGGGRHGYFLSGNKGAASVGFLRSHQLQSKVQPSSRLRFISSKIQPFCLTSISTSREILGL